MLRLPLFRESSQIMTKSELLLWATKIRLGAVCGHQLTNHDPLSWNLYIDGAYIAQVVGDTKEDRILHFIPEAPINRPIVNQDKIEWSLRFAKHLEDYAEDLND